MDRDNGREFDIETVGEVFFSSAATSRVVVVQPLPAVVRPV
jgi:hypothetical protein